MKRLLSALSAALILGSAMPALAADTTRPTVGTPSPGQATAGVAVTISAPVSDDASGIASCNLYVDNDDTGSMTISPGTASKSYVFAQAGIHTIFVFCRDGANNFNSGPNASVTASVASGSGDMSLPVVGQTMPAVAVVGAAVVFSANVSDTGSGISSCQLFVDGFSKGTMTISLGTASRSYIFDAPGIHQAYVQCFDGVGNTGSGPQSPVTVSAATVPQTAPPVASSTLVKLACPADATASHPCKAVYYRSTDGKRHAFPNSNVYFTWYQDFSTVKDISASEMSALPLGPQVTYRPGSKLVKFATLNNVYAVTKRGTLRWLRSEAVAIALYGTSWNKNIDDISDAFFLDYRFGADVSTVQDYSPSAELAGTTTIDENF